MPVVGSRVYHDAILADQRRYDHCLSASGSGCGDRYDADRRVASPKVGRVTLCPLPGFVALRSELRDPRHLACRTHHLKKVYGQLLSCERIRVLSWGQPLSAKRTPESIL